MAKITQAVFLYLAGETPAYLQLPRLRTSRSTFAVIQRAFTQYLASDVAWTYCEDIAQLPTPDDPGLTVVYLMGHAWLKDNGFATAVLVNNSSAEVTGNDIISLLSPYLRGPSLLFFDMCNAASIASVLEQPEYQRVAAIFGSASEESALEFPFDSAMSAPILVEATGSIHKTPWFIPQCLKLETLCRSWKSQRVA